MVILALDISASSIGWARWSMTTGNIESGRGPTDDRPANNRPPRT